MKRFLMILLAFYTGSCFAIASQDAKRIGEKIWKNECKGSIEGLTHWGKGEDFPSLGIGHFIWYRVGQQEKFQQTFPDLLVFLNEKQAIFPAWLKSISGCPWKSREEFYHKFQSDEMKSLRQFLFETRHLQAEFMANRLEKIFPQIIEKLPDQEKKRVIQVFQRLAQDAKGLYALIDYLNFKGSGTFFTETYQGEGWGLLQVLQRIPFNTSIPLIDFVKAAKAVLTQRVQNSPFERHEERWLPGWLNRVESYLEEL